MASFSACSAICDSPALAGEGWGGGVSATGQSPRGRNPHPPRAGRCFASPGACRPLPQAGEAKNRLTAPFAAPRRSGRDRSGSDCGSFRGWH
ncbi:hypothetical protein EAS54_27330 [Bradyrhizobium guangzhouense]|nr:hypothetical protein EAS54_27330 [Bradyrhizobium guangzhouense]